MIVIMKNEKEFVEHLNNNMPREEKIVMLQKELDLLCQVGVEHLFCIRKHWEVNNTNVSELNAIAQCMFQMIWLKAKTLLQLVGSARRGGVDGGGASTLAQGQGRQEGTAKG